MEKQRGGYIIASDYNIKDFTEKVRENINKKGYKFLGELEVCSRLGKTQFTQAFKDGDVLLKKEEKTRSTLTRFTEEDSTAQKKIDYKVIENEPDKFMKLVNYHLENGWKPKGNIKTAALLDKNGSKETGFIFVQDLIKE